MIVEQKGSEEYRNKYDQYTNSFYKTNKKNLGYQRGFIGVYGWIDNLGSPPDRHLDVLLPTKNEYSLGQRVNVKVIGCFLRKDHDNKIVAIESYRTENDIQELPIEEMEMLRKLYPRIEKEEGWFGKEMALTIINNF